MRFKTIEVKSGGIRKLKDINPYSHVNNLITKLMLYSIMNGGLK